MKDCTYCSGTGYEQITCTDCEGTGQKRVYIGPKVKPTGQGLLGALGQLAQLPYLAQESKDPANYEWKNENCDKCNGQGSVRATASNGKWSECRMCLGSGKLKD